MTLKFKHQAAMESKLEAERRCDIAAAKLSVAEELRLAIAGPFAFILYLKYHSWVLATIVGIITFFIVTHWYEKEYDAANDAYERLTGTGKYYTPNEPDETG
ncbi:MAG: hypothetical protein V3U89_01195 [Methylophilaceae bacterium]